MNTVAQINVMLCCQQMFSVVWIYSALSAFLVCFLRCSEQGTRHFFSVTVSSPGKDQPIWSSVDPKTGEGAGSTLPSSHPNTGEGSAVPYLLHWRASPAGSVVKLNRSIFDAVTRTNKLCIPSSGYNLLYIVRYYMILLTLLCQTSCTCTALYSFSAF